MGSFEWHCEYEVSQNPPEGSHRRSPRYPHLHTCHSLQCSKRYPASIRLVSLLAVSSCRAMLCLCANAVSHVHTPGNFGCSGTGQFRRTKWVWVQWSGEEVGAIARSRAVYGGAVEVFQRVLAPYSVQLHVGRHEEVAPEIVIERCASPQCKRLSDRNVQMPQLAEAVAGRWCMAVGCHWIQYQVCHRQRWRFFRQF